jgi:H+/Cl- antiporter ClcA
MKTYRDRVARKWRWWALSSVIVLLFILAVGWALLDLADDIGYQYRYLAIIGGLLILIAFFFGQAVQSILVRSWDNWIADLGPTQIKVLIEEMKKKAETDE